MTYKDLAEFILNELPSDYQHNTVTGLLDLGDCDKIEGRLNGLVLTYPITKGLLQLPILKLDFTNED